MKVVLLPQAMADLAEVTGPLLSQVMKRLEALREYPLLGSALTGPFAGYRSTVVDPLRIVYKATKGSVLVAYVRHCRRS